MKNTNLKPNKKWDEIIQKPFKVDFLKGVEDFGKYFQGEVVNKDTVDMNDPVAVIENGMTLDWNSVSAEIKMNDLTMYKIEDSKFFANALRIAKENHPHGEQVYFRGEGKYKNVKKFVLVSEDKTVVGGGALDMDDDGEEHDHVISIFKNSEYEKSILDEVMLTLVANGGKVIDCWKGFISEIYSRRYGFGEIATSTPYDGLVNDDWDEEKHGKPDVVLMTMAPYRTVEEILEKQGTFEKLNYEKTILECETFDDALEALQVTSNILDNMEELDIDSAWVDMDEYDTDYIEESNEEFEIGA